MGQGGRRCSERGLSLSSSGTDASHDWVKSGETEIPHIDVMWKFGEGMPVLKAWAGLDLAFKEPMGLGTASERTGCETMFICNDEWKRFDGT
ncbi:hypothetical protein TNCV_2359081 [Trichonephila clavipes]|nr:hypothetical protein TNCV_2359081 [Trichonephila clavipes]